MLRFNMRRGLVLMAAGFLWHLASEQAIAQYYPVAPPGVAPVAPGGYPYGYGAYPLAGGYWQGAASALDAYGNVGLDQEQARILREKANQARLDTQVKITDVMAYERANKYWYSDQQIDIQGKLVQAAMNNPPIQEVTSGRALNTLLNYLDKVMAMSTSGPKIPIDPSVVRSMNTTSGSNGGNAGLLKDVNKLQWPVATEGANQKKLDQMLKDTTYGALKAQPSPTSISQLNRQVDLVQGDVKQKFYNSEVDSGEYLDGNRFLERVRAAIQALKQPNIGTVLAGQLGPTGTSVDEVVYSMASRGLTFAAAQPGQESAYVAMHRAFVNFGLVASAPDTGFRVRVGGGINIPVKK